MDIVTNSNKNGKRVHFSPMESSYNPIFTTAIDMAKTSITVTLMSLPPAISSFTGPFTEFSKLHHELYSCSQNQGCITKDSAHIPCLACFEFKIRASVRVLKHYGDQFKTLLEQTKQHIAVLQLQVHDTIVSLTDLEVNNCHCLPLHLA